MPIADNPGQTADAGFVRAYDARAARRQFQVSIVLVLVLAFAATALSLLTRLDRPVNMGRSAPIALRGTQVAGTLLDIRR
ncbi:MAG: hypothetical protein L0Y50_03815 [Beijerinckiaceae bacterium]|nr:hypothetical protein [Beijerinckiaceae bacterium]MCI0735389.1 hypothetical protein [Beijerinckiaceae bacterium]